MNIGKLLLHYRAAEKLGQRELAATIGISYSTLCRIENGEEPSGRTLAAILRWTLEDERIRCP